MRVTDGISEERRRRDGFIHLSLFCHISNSSRAGSRGMPAGAVTEVLKSVPSSLVPRVRVPQTYQVQGNLGFPFEFPPLVFTSLFFR